MKVGETSKETSAASTVGGAMGATSEAPLAPNSSLVSVKIPVGSPPECSSTGSPLATELPAKPTDSPKTAAGSDSSTVRAESTTVLSKPETKDSLLPIEVDTIQKELNGNKVAIGSSVASSSTSTTETPVPTEPQSSTEVRKPHVVPAIPVKEFGPPNTQAMTTFPAISSPSLTFLSRPPPVSSFSRPLPPFTSRPIASNLNGSGPSKFNYCSGGTTFNNGAPLTRPFNIPSRGPPSLTSPPMRSPVCGPAQGLYSTSSPGGVHSPTGAILYPSLSSSTTTFSLAHDSQARSYSFPRGPPPPSIPYGFGRNHSWPSETSGHSIPTFRSPLVSSSPIPPPFQSPYQGLRPRGGSRQPQTLRISKWVNPIPPDPDDGQQQTGEQELATKMLQIQSKRFYIDVKQNRRGRFMKVAEIGADGRRNQVFLALSTAAEFRDHLSMFSEFYSNLGPPNPDTLPEDGKLKSETMVKDNRRYYLDLKENSRGRFLRVSQTIARGGPRCQIAIPAQGMIEFRDALQELLEEFGTDDGGFKGELPEGRHMRVENKNFYFDIGQNNRGIYMRISEVKTNFRTAITIPEKSWSRFRDIFADYVDKMKEGGEKNSSESNK